MSDTMTNTGNPGRLWRRLDPARSFFTMIGFLVIVILLGIFMLLMANSLPFFDQYAAGDFLTGTRWNPTSHQQVGYGVLPLLVSTVFVTVGAMLIAVPLGVGAALYLSEVAPYRVREFLKPVIELLASVPSVVVGFLGLTVLAPLLAKLTGMTNGLNAANGAILLSVMALPTIISLSEDSLRSVPNSFREASYALGANKWETMTRVCLPAARSGIFAAVMLGLGRAIGETMTVLMVCGNASHMPGSFLDSVRTLTATVAIELGEVPYYSTHYHALFAVGLVLFILTFFVNMAADIVLRRQQRLLSGQVKKKPAKEEAVMPNKEQALTRKKRLVSGLGNALILSCTLLIVLLIIVITIDVFAGGASALSWEFLTEMPRDRMTQGGILPCIIGTFYVTIITTIFSIPFGVATAIYLNEYARDNKLTRVIRLAIRNLSGVPSIVYGMFGVALFVDMFGFGTSILSAGLTLGLLTIPWTITASEEALKAVPVSFREGSLALGATKWYTIRKNVLPYAIPGIITGGILGLARAAGETAPILFTGAAFSLPAIPGSIFDQFMALPYHIYILATQHEKIEQVRPLAYGTALVLIALVFLLSLFAIILRIRIRKRGIVNY